MAKKIKVDPEQILWKDRKRWLGMPLSFTRYSVSENRLILKIGFFSTVTDEILLYRILDIKLRQSFGQKLFGVGTITLFSADQSNQVLELKNIKRPEAVRRFLSRIIEQERATRGLVGHEILGASAHAAGHAVDPSTPVHQFVDIDGDGIPD